MMPAVSGAVAFLERAQAEDGSWHDWNLAPGRSDGWTTAYVGRQLAGLAGDSAHSAAHWLASHELVGGGWGYNADVGADADSSALALDLLDQFGMAGSSHRCLERFRSPDGGFSTYRADDGLGSWGCSQVDVSATVGHVLPPEAELLDFVLTRRRVDGLWDSFWWVSPLYATRACLSLLARCRIAIGVGGALREFDADTAFERALLLDCAVLVDDRSLAQRLTRLLLDTQCEDGGWVSAPMLRLTDRGCARPWAQADAGPLYADQARLFTTATVLRALKAWCMIEA